MKLLNQLGQKLVNLLGEKTNLDDLIEGKERSSDFLDPDYLSDLLFYRIYDEEHKIYENKKSFGFVIEVGPLLGASPVEERELSTLIREIGAEGSSIQCLRFADYRIDRFLECWSKARRSKGKIYEEIAKKKEAFFKKDSHQGDVPPRIFRFLFSYSEPKGSAEGLSITLDRLVEKKAKALDVLNRISGKSAFEVEPLQLIEVLSGIMNFAKQPVVNCRKKWNKETWLSKQICNPGSALEVKKDGLLFHENNNTSLFKTYEVTDYPSEWSLGLMGELIGDFFNKSYRIPTPFYIHYGIHFPSQQKVETKFRGKSKILDHQMKFPSLVRVFPEMPREHQEHLLVHKELINGEKFVETRFSCGLWSEPSSHVASESTLIALFQKYGFKLKENTFIHLPDLISSLPMAWGEDAPYIKNLKRTRCFRTTMSSETGSLIPLLAEWWGNSTKGMILFGRRGQIASWDPFMTEGNLNTVVIGPSGSGKSVFMQDLILNHLGQGDRVFILDLGRSFEKLCHLLKGQYLEFSSKSHLNLNPFGFIKASSEAIDTGLEMVAGIMATMAMPTHKIDKERSDLLSAIVKEAWVKKGYEASVDTVIDLLKSKRFQSELMTGAAESLQEGLKKFSTLGPFSSYFYGSKSVDLSQNLVVIETEELKNMADLQAVILQIFMMTISNQVFMGNRENRCLICIDEAWDLLKSPQMEGFIESLARRLRKYNGALVVGTQSLKDFERSYGAKAAYQNSNWLCILGKDTDSINTIKRDNLFSLDQFKEYALESLRMEEGKYSEVFIYNKGSGFFSINQLKLDPFSAMLYSTKADEFQAVQELQNLGLNTEDSINWLVTHKPLFKQLLGQGKKVKEIIPFLLKNHPNQGNNDEK